MLQGNKTSISCLYNLCLTNKLYKNILYDKLLHIKKYNNYQNMYNNFIISYRRLIKNVLMYL